MTFHSSIDSEFVRLKTHLSVETLVIFQTTRP